MLISESYFVTLFLAITAATYIATAQTLQDSNILLDDPDITNVDKPNSFQNIG